MRAVALALCVCLLAGAAHAQGIYSTRDNPTPPLTQPQRKPLPDPRQLYAPVPPNARGMLTPAPSNGRQQVQSPQTRGVPFGRASAEALVPVPKGPRTTSAAPIESIDSGELDFLETETSIASEDLPPPIENVSEPAEPEVVVYEEEDPAHPVTAVRLRGLHKVTAKVETLEAPMDEAVRFGRLEIRPRACRVSESEGTQESAALVEVIEYPAQRYDVAQADGLVLGDAPAPAWQQPKSQPGKPIFSGWLFASSPSINGLEHPVYDISMVECVKGDALSD